MSEIEGKVKYVKLARSLQTYGVSFFLVKVSVSRLFSPPKIHFYTIKIKISSPSHKIRLIVIGSFISYS